MSQILTSWKRQTIFWLIMAVSFFLAIALLREILLPFIMGLAIAYFLDPVVDLLEEAGLSRLWATIVISVGFGLILVAILLVLVPILVHEAANLAASAPENIQKLKMGVLEWRSEFFGEMESQNKARFDATFSEVAKQLAQWSAVGATKILSSSFAIFNFISVILITPVVAFYLLKDWGSIIALVDKSLPKDYAETIRSLASEMNTVMAGFVRGQVTVLLLLGLFYVVALSLVGLNFGVLIGIVSGLVSFIPFVGSAVGFILGGAVALAQYGYEWQPIAIVIGIFLAGQLIEGDFLSPKIVGDSVKLHPVWLIFSLFVFGYLLGFLGLIIAVPVAASIGVLVRFGFEKYYESEFYQGRGEG